MFSAIVTFIKRCFNDTRRPPGIESSDETKRPVDPLELIQMAFNEHGIAASLVGDEVVLERHDLRFGSALFDKTRPGQDHHLLLEIYIFSPLMTAQPIAEAFSGLGETRDMAILNAFEKFLRCTFHVVIEALADHVCDSMQAEVESWGRTGARWKVYAGPVISYSAGATTLSKSYPTFFVGLERLFSNAASSDSHFVRVFVASHGGSIAGLEVLLDNETWPEGEELLARQDWQCGQEYQSLRQVILALPDARPPS